MVEDSMLYISGDHIISSHSDFAHNFIVSDGVLTVEDHANVLNIATVDGNVSIGNFAFIYELHLLEPGEIFFNGENSLIYQLYAPNGLIVHVLPNCNWEKFVQFLHCKQVEVRHDIVL